MYKSRSRYIGYLRENTSSAIIVNKQNVLQFYVEFACARPSSVPEYVSAFATSLEPFGFQDDT